MDHFATISTLISPALMLPGPCGPLEQTTSDLKWNWGVQVLYCHVHLYHIQPHTPAHLNHVYIFFFFFDRQSRIFHKR